MDDTNFLLETEITNCTNLVSIPKIFHSIKLTPVKYNYLIIVKDRTTVNVPFVVRKYLCHKMEKKDIQVTFKKALSTVELQIYFFRGCIYTVRKYEIPIKKIV